MKTILEKMLPRRFWSKPPLPQERFWEAMQNVTDDNAVYRALMFEAQDRFMQNATLAFDRSQPDDKRLAAADVAAEMAAFMERIESYRAAAPAQVDRLSRNAA